MEEEAAAASASVPSAAQVLRCRRPLFFGPDSKWPDAFVFSGSVLALLGLFLLLAAGLLLLNGDSATRDGKQDMWQRVVLASGGGFVAVVGLACFAVRLLTARRVRLSVRSSVTDFSRDLGRRLHAVADRTAPSQAHAATVAAEAASRFATASAVSE